MDNTPLRYIPEPDHVFIPDLSGAPNSSNPPAPTPPEPAPVKGEPWISKKILFLGAAVILGLILVAVRVLAMPPAGFPTDSILVIENGQTLSTEAKMLKEESVIRSPRAFKLFMTLFGGRRSLLAGDYYLEKKQDVIALSWRLSHAKYELKSIRITIPEGFNTQEIADLFTKEKKFAHFDKKEFVSLASPYEGYLFPDTYIFLPSITASGVIDAMLLNYQKRIAPLAEDVKRFGRPIKDIINMASIIEEEARTEETRKTIAGILWKRLDEGMPLQVDAAFAFVNGKKDSRYLTAEDLKIDSPYNTYIHNGLPPTPIANPGIDAIRATIDPIKTKYYFYLSDDEGNMHYAITHDGHLANKGKYLSY